jgi:hypothetical protein
MFSSRKILPSINFFFTEQRSSTACNDGTQMVDRYMIPTTIKIYEKRDDLEQEYFSTTLSAFGRHDLAFSVHDSHRCGRRRKVDNFFEASGGATPRIEAT